MFSQNDVRLIQQRQTELQRQAKRHNEARWARRSVRQTRKTTNRWLRVMSLFL